MQKSIMPKFSASDWAATLDALLASGCTQLWLKDRPQVKVSIIDICWNFN